MSDVIFVLPCPFALLLRMYIYRVKQLGDYWYWLKEDEILALVIGI